MSAQQYDLAVIGLGAMGSMAAWRAADRGANVVGFEQFGLAHPWGSSHGGSRIFRRTLFEGVDYIPIIERAAPLWAALGKETGTELLLRCGGLCVGQPDGDLVRGALRAADAGGFEHRLLDPDRFAAEYPQYSTVDGDVAVFEPGAGVLNPEECIRAATGRAQELGAELHFETRVTGFRAGGNDIEITTATTTYRARRAIVATGAWFTDLVPGVELRVQRSPLVWFTGADRAAYRPDRFPTFVRKSGELDGWGIPDVDGRGVKIGAGPSAPKPWLLHADDNRYPIDARDTDPVERFCALSFPGLDPRAADATPCLNSRTADRDFVIGTMPELPGVVLAGGFSGHGFKHSAGVGDISAELALDGGSDVSLSLFDPRRLGAETDGGSGR